MTFDLILDSLSKTAIDVIQDMTKVIKAITVILLITRAHLRRRKHKTGYCQHGDQIFEPASSVEQYGYEKGGPDYSQQKTLQNYNKYTFHIYSFFL